MAPRGRRRSPISLVSGLSSSPMLTLFVFPCLLFLISFTSPVAAAGSGVIGIDVGTEYIKAALVKPGIPLEIILTKDSKRKESAAVAFKPTRENDAVFPERFYGGDALALAARYPDEVYANLKSLLGVPFEGEESIVQTYHDRYPALRLESAPGERGTVSIRSSKLGQEEGKEPFLIEEILAMQLKQIKANADSLAGKGSDIRDVVITYPAFYTAEEKRSLEFAAELAGLNVDALISDGLAVGLNYATSRTFPSVSDGQKPEYHVVYDMGAGSTTASVLRFQARSVKDVGRFNKTIQEIQVMGTGWDRTLGGDALNDLILNDMIETLAGNPKLKDRASTSDIRSHGKTVARLWKDAEKIRQILSANTETGTTLESLYEEDLNFKYKIARSRFEQLAKDYTDRVGTPLEQALAVAGLDLNDIDSIILHGGASRTPFVQKELERFCGSSNKIRTNVNADEAAAFGATFKGAALSPSFRVKDIRASDAATYAISLQWKTETKERQQKLFTPTSSVGPEKQVTLKNLDDFEFSFYQQVGNGEALTDLPILGVQTTNLTASVTKLKEEFGCTEANITTKFSVRLNPIDGLPEVLSGSVSCEVEAQKKGSVVDDVKGFFGLGSKKEEEAPLEEDGEPTESITLEAEDPQTSTSTSAESTSTVSVKEAKKAAPQTQIEAIPIKFTTSALGTPAPSAAELGRIKARLVAFDDSDRERVLREVALNELESFIYRSRDLVEDESFAQFVKADQLALLNERVAAASEWLYDDGDNAKTPAFQEKLKSLQDIVSPALKRREESSSRPARVKLLQDTLKSAKSFVDLLETQIQNDEELFSSSLSSTTATESDSSSTAASASESATSATADPFEELDDDPYSTSTTSTPTATPSAKPSAPKYSVFQPADLASLSKTYNSINGWFEAQLAVQETLTDSDDPALTVSEVNVRLRELERTLNRVYEKMGAAAARSGKGSGSSKEERPKKKSDKKADKEKKEKEKTSSVKDEL
ncbi:hypothetical protein ASPZODRAFT_68836 [Penicilliopsis zonata CBS 506.65]|uniref:Uncharacterized protein n=1 Tax=Penicilliopsis zonata CBS 506.65 TaxID=1073090 RepID=A0A1L9SEK4_9EURO|nr:hypothetical protein ASPZODRAFT_68836 [Penicilliopsis zonata CBS 506.65]OJJ45582.1 hypothetical protein ASPZODRAFT_68836 [Penicilliopsis zonata CBS 506.65]